MATTVALFKRYGWKIIVLGSGALAGMATQRFLEQLWKLVRDEAQPPIPADRDRTWFDALSWAVATGAGAGVARLVTIRAASRVWEAAINEPPPEPGLTESTG